MSSELTPIVRISSQRYEGFNYAYRRTASPSTVAPTPNSTSSALPASGRNAETPGLSTKGSGTPILNDKPLPPHLTGGKSKPSTPPLPGSNPETPKDTKPNGTFPVDKAEKERAKRERKKEKKLQERAEREAAAKGGASGQTSPVTGEREDNAPLASSHEPQSGKATPEIVLPSSAEHLGDGLASPDTESTGARTPTGRRTQRNPWTIFMRLSVPANEQEVRDFFQDAKNGVRFFSFFRAASILNIPPPDHKSIIPDELRRQATKDGIHRVRGRRKHEGWS